MPYLLGEKSGPPHDTLYLRKFDQGVFAVRNGDYKLVIPKSNGAPELYDLANDPAEKKNLSRDNPETLGELDKLRAAWDLQLIPPVFEGLKTAKKTKP